MTVAEVLRVARALVERGWTKGVFARDKRGVTTLVCDDDAVKFCALGAIIRVTTIEKDAPYPEPLYALAQAIGAFHRNDGQAAGEVSSWNDDPSRVLGEVLAAYDRAIVSAEGTKSP